jgi:hypothetical protein
MFRKKKEKRRKIKMIRKINKKKLYSNKAIRIFRKRIAKGIVENEDRSKFRKS